VFALFVSTGELDTDALSEAGVSACSVFFPQDASMIAAAVMSIGMVLVIVIVSDF
jgi:hypothetical protein